ncbi:MAG: hypothetical protein CVT64_05640 [Actinobacteria bacterium HGW-Actinobacteria-4]|nr:MAG: hypothetical protein CVT64_05640 [Actinobacteria bacterium HGW-Actinobacteria-4]
MATVNLYWIPLGAGGNGFVRTNGRLYEALAARRDRRTPLALYHSALTVELEGHAFVIENAWPSPDADTSSRGVVVEGPVFATWASRWRAFRYEVRCWEGGEIPDIGHAVGGPCVVSRDPALAERILASAPSVPALRWGRVVPGTADMWNSNSTIAWLLSVCGVQSDALRPPPQGRAPGWEAGLTVALRAHVAAGD